MLLGGRDKIEVHFSVTDSPSNTKVKGSGVTKGRAKGYQEARKKVEERRSPTLNPKPSLTTLTPEGTYAEEKKEPPRFTGTTFKDRTETSPLPYRDLKSRDLSSPEKKAVRLAWTAQSSTAQSGTVQEAGTTKSESSRGHRARRDNSEPEVNPSRQADLGLKGTRRENLKQKNGTQDLRGGRRSSRAGLQEARKRYAREGEQDLGPGWNFSVQPDDPWALFRAGDSILELDGISSPRLREKRSKAASQTRSSQEWPHPGVPRDTAYGSDTCSSLEVRSPRELNRASSRSLPGNRQRRPGS